ncbi:TRAP transporter TAXI family solute receptor [Evansella vedderi]|uniref:TRAP transporter TAXI family solute receptor n=1 Tax=Evansella vedderi TaxID=38282 RepID=A0ABT9ZPZ0_9BACI|nr:TAXI family TRAP transporter solute-binding subunit [Evansella vedderi]MDQ0253305.1 TRAP transporter TAXI family solute receptor [Evansella vedderi]
MRLLNVKLGVLLVGLFVLSLVALGCSNDAGSNTEGGDTEFSIGTAGTGGALYPMGVAMGQVISENSDYVVNGQASEGTVENIRNLSENRIGWIIAQNEVAYFAYKGENEYEGREFEEISSLFATIDGWVQIFVSADSEIQSVSDFEGKRIGVGAPGSGGETTSRRVLDFYGLTFDDIQAERISDGEMVEALSDGTIEGFISTHPLNSAPLMDLVSSTDVRMIGIEEEEFYETYPYYSPATIADDVYEGVNSVQTATSKVFMYTRNDTYTEDQIYELLGLIFDNRDDWVGAHASLEVITVENALDGIVIPLHPGAVKFFEERGLDIPEDMRP